MTEQRRGDWLQTYTGKKFWPMDPRAEDFDVLDIAHALANTCRYNGHCTQFYSVAEHSIIISSLSPPGCELWGLLHDASEAYLCDIPRPLKRHLTEFKVLEAACDKALAEAFGLPWPIPDEVMAIDRAMLRVERRDLMIGQEFAWKTDDSPLLSVKIQRPLSPDAAEEFFLDRYQELTMEKKT